MNVFLVIYQDPSFVYYIEIEFINLQYGEDLKSKFLACHILDFYKNHVFPSE